MLWSCLMPLEWCQGGFCIINVSITACLFQFRFWGRCWCLRQSPTLHRLPLPSKMLERICCTAKKASCSCPYIPSHTMPSHSTQRLKSWNPTSLKAVPGCFPLSRLSLLEAGHKVQKQGYITLPFPRTLESWALCPSLCTVNLDWCLSVAKARFFHTHLILPFQTRNICQSVPCKDTVQ